MPWACAHSVRFTGQAYYLEHAFAIQSTLNGYTAPTLAAAFHPAAADKAVLVLNALLGLGTALAPVFVAAFTGLGFWIGLPVLAACLLAGLIAVSLRLPLHPEPAQPSVPHPAQHPAQPSVLPQPRPTAASRIPAEFWFFAAFAVLYGWCETMNGNWSQLDVTSLGVKAATALLALTGFWAAVTAGRVLLARGWLSSWAGCRWRWRIASHHPPRSIPGQHARGRDPGRPYRPGRPRPDRALMIPNGPGFPIGTGSTHRVVPRLPAASRLAACSGLA